MALSLVAACGGCVSRTSDPTECAACIATVDSLREVNQYLADQAESREFSLEQIGRAVPPNLDTICDPDDRTPTLVLLFDYVGCGSCVTILGNQLEREAERAANVRILLVAAPGVLALSQSAARVLRGLDLRADVVPVRRPLLPEHLGRAKIVGVRDGRVVGFHISLIAGSLEDQHALSRILTQLTEE